MLYGNETISAFTRSNMAIWMALAFQAGALNIGGFLACGRFVSHVTGFATYFAIEIDKKNFVSAFGMLLVPAFFLLGAIVSGIMVDLRLKLHKRPKYYIIFGILFFLMLFVVVSGFNGFFGTFGGEPLLSDYLLLAILCLMCGMQNGLITTVSRSVIRTTHLTGITTDLGIGLVRVFFRKKINQPMDDENKANLARAAIIFCFGLGSMVGGIGFVRAGYRGFLLPLFVSGCLFLATFYFGRFRAHPNPNVQKH